MCEVYLLLFIFILAMRFHLTIFFCIRNDDFSDKPNINYSEILWVNEHDAKEENAETVLICIVL